MALRYFQVHKGGKNVSGQITYGSLAEAALALTDAPEGSEVVEINAKNDIIRRYSQEESEKAASKFREQ
jgi:hypothetical protein